MMFKDSKKVFLTHLLLLVVSTLLLTSLSSAVTFNPGVVISNENVDYTFQRSITVDNLTVGGNYLLFENDNLSFIPVTGSIDINVYGWVDNANHNFSMLGTGNDVGFTISSEGVGASLYYDSNYTNTPLTTLTTETFFFYQLNTPINFTLLNENNKSIIGDNVSLEFISDETSSKYYTNKGWLYKTLPKTEYVIRYGGDNYSTRFYYLDLVNIDYSAAIPLYFINNTNAYPLTVTVIDQYGIVVSGVQVKALKYYIDTNSFLLQETQTTDDNGEADITLTYNDEYYKFMIQKDGVTIKTTAPAYITGEVISITVTLGEEIGADYETWNNLEHSLTYNDNTNNFRLNWNNIDGVASNICFYIYENRYTGQVLANSTCSLVASGTILFPANNNSGYSYTAKAYYKNLAGENNFLSSLTKSFNSNVSTGNLGLLLQILLTGVMVLLAFWSPPVAINLVPLSLIVGRAVGLNIFPYEALIPLQIGGIIIAYYISNKS